MRYILAGYHGSDSSLQAVLCARDMANQTGARLQIVTVATFPAMGLDVCMDTVMQEEVTHCERLVDALRRRLGSGDTAQLILRVGNPAVEIIDQAREFGVSRIVLGSRRHWFGRWPVSRIVHQVQAMAPCEVIVARDTRGARRFVIDDAVGERPA